MAVDFTDSVNEAIAAVFSGWVGCPGVLVFEDAAESCVCVGDISAAIPDPAVLADAQAELARITRKARLRSKFLI
jgi:hypothetical protein